MSRKKLAWLSAIALACVALYVCLARRYPIGPSLAEPRASWASLVTPSALNLALHLALYLALTLLYLGAMRLLMPGEAEGDALPRRQIALILTAWLACSAALLFAAPAGESHDVFDYLFRGRLMVEYQANPLAEVPDTFSISMPYTRYLAWRKNVDTYGPLWEASSAAVAGAVRQVANWLGWWDEASPVCPGSPESCRILIVYVTGYRLLAIILTGLAGWLVASIVRQRQSAFVPLALVAWLWNPLTLVASALGAHNDMLMLVLVLLCCWLLQRGRLFWGLLVLLLAAHVKLTALIWLPACGLWIVWRYGWRRALKTGLAAAASGLALSWLLYAPFAGWQTLPRMLQERSAYLANSPWQMLKFFLTEIKGWPTPRANQLSTSLSNGLAIAGVLLIPLWRFNFRPKRWRSADIPIEQADQALWRTLAGVSFAFLLLGSFWFQHWYVLWLLALAVLLPGNRWTNLYLPWLAFGALCSNAVMGFFTAPMLEATSALQRTALSVAITWGALLVAISIQALKKKLRQSRW